MVSIVAGKPSVAIGETGIYWAPVSQSVRVSFAGTDQITVAEALEKSFGPFPIRLSIDKFDILRAMGYAAGQGETPYKDIAQALFKFGELELTRA